MTQQAAMIESEVVTEEGVRLVVRRYGATGVAIARILLVHGVCEHGGRYGHLANWLAGRGVEVVIPDLRGHGKSGGGRAHVTNFDVYLNDLRLILDSLPSPLPLVVLGHSMGGLVAIRLAQTYPNLMSGLCLSSPLLKVALHVPRWKRLLATGLVWLIPELRFRTNIRATNMSRDEQFLARRRADPLIQKSVTAAWFLAMESAKEQAWNGPVIDCPVLAFQGGQDATVQPEALRDWLRERVKGPQRLEWREDEVHELFNDGHWEEHAGELLGWLGQEVVRANGLDKKQ